MRRVNDACSAGFAHVRHELPPGPFSPAPLQSRFPAASKRRHTTSRRQQAWHVYGPPPPTSAGDCQSPPSLKQMGYPFKHHPSKRIRRLPDDPSEPYSPNYGSSGTRSSLPLHKAGNSQPSSGQVRSKSRTVNALPFSRGKLGSISAA